MVTFLLKPSHRQALWRCNPNKQVISRYKVFDKSASKINIHRTENKKGVRKSYTFKYINGFGMI
jgi:hypothetical protein